jgi:hypothetical protein
MLWRNHECKNILKYNDGVGLGTRLAESLDAREKCHAISYLGKITEKNDY